MESQGFVFLFIQEENKINTSRRIFKFVEVLNELKMETKTPGDNENCLTLLSDMKYKPNLIIVNIGHPFLEQIIQTSQKVRQFIPIVLIYTSKTFNELQKIEEKYGLKYDLEKSKINILEFRVLYEQIKSSSQFLTQTEENKRYSYILQIGSGTSATVHLVHDNEKNRKVAMKKIDSSEMKDTEKERVQKEVENMKSMSIPTFIEFYDYENDNDTQKIYMEYADQGTLENKIAQMKKEGKDFTSEEIFNIFIQILLGLYALNENGYMHQDIKSENILLKNQKIKEKNYLVVKLSEIGFSRKLDGKIGSKSHFGTPYYLSPEIASNEEKYDFNSDIWSLGVILYEMATNKLPWFQPKINYEEYLKLMINNKKAPLPENVNEKIKYLIKIMLKKDPERRATLKEIITLDFVYKKIEDILNEYDWWKYYESIKDLKNEIKPCYLFLELLTTETINYLSDASKIFTYCQNKRYNQGYFSYSYNFAKNGKDVLDLFSDLKKWGSDSINYKMDTPKDFLEYLLSNQVIRCISHPINNTEDKNEINNFINNFLNDPSNFIFQNTVDFDKNQLVDNKYIININKCNLKNDFEKLDFLLISQFILNCGLNLYNKSIKNNKEIEQLSSDKNYLNFLFGISLFQECDIFNIPYNSKNHSRLAFLLNLYQIMILHFVFNKYLNNCKKKGGVLSFLPSEETINYQFKNFTLNNLEIKHVIFRNNKKVPGRLFRLVYQNDKKCQILPNFNNLKPLLLLNDLNKDISGFIFKIFNKKEVFQQLDDITYKFIKLKIVLSSEEELLISSHIKYLIKDFGEFDIEHNPKEFLMFLVKFLEKEKKLIIYKSRIKEVDKAGQFLNRNFIKNIKKENIKILYI